MEAASFPALNPMISKWVPQDDKESWVALYYKQSTKPIGITKYISSAFSRTQITKIFFIFFLKWYLCLNSGRQASFVSFAYVGGTFGTILALPLCGLIIKTLGWQVKNGILNFFDIVVFIYLAFITNQLIVHVT